MKANELRLGNFIYSFGNKTDVTTKVLEAIESEYMGGSPFEPIPLTTDWYEDLGLTWCEMRNGWAIMVSESNSMVCDGRGDVEIGDDVKLDSPLRYVHDLQNLYFELTGEELTINAL
jgi:hypothetical protein